ncbi:efflux RND transporter permease subunit [Methanocaldococcus villosus]|uniref:efflux RND transporter permease subunit n=1 Tax=Methanocaldococcus villosus TaxID=667126 RepID=UPI000373A6B3
MRKIFKKIANFSEKHPFTVLGIIFIITLFMAISATNIKSQTAFEKFLPQNNEIVKTLYQVRDEFGGTDIITITVKIVPSDASDKVIDIRDPRVLRAVKELEDNIRTIDGITNVNSPVDTIIKLNNGKVPDSLDQVKDLLKKLPEEQRRKMFNSDYSMMIIHAFTDAGGDQKKLFRILKQVKSYMYESPFPPGVEVIYTGTPPLRELLYNLMKESQTFTTVVGLVAILIILFLYFKKPISSFLPLIPVAISVIWTGGVMGLLGIPLDMATAGIGSLILGLGIDYGIHLMHRYNEEKRKGLPVDKAIEIAVVETGSAVMATTATTVAGFLALVLAPLPMMVNLGKVCALGITFCMIVVLTLLPSLLIIEDRYILPLIKGEKNE